MSGVPTVQDIAICHIGFRTFLKIDKTNQSYRYKKAPSRVLRAIGKMKDFSNNTGNYLQEISSQNQPDFDGVSHEPGPFLAIKHLPPFVTFSPFAT